MDGCSNKHGERHKCPHVYAMLVLRNLSTVILIDFDVDKCGEVLHFLNKPLVVPMINTLSEMFHKYFTVPMPEISYQRLPNGVFLHSFRIILFMNFFGQ